jgi:hypothetical protein
MFNNTSNYRVKTLNYEKKNNNIRNFLIYYYFLIANTSLC